MKLITYFNAMEIARDEMVRCITSRPKGRFGIRVDKDEFALRYVKLWRQYEKFSDVIRQLIMEIDND